jgi:hypothetical protein
VRRAPFAAVVFALLAAPALASAAPEAPARAAQEAQTRFSVVNGCYALRSRSLNRLVAKGGGGYTASAGSPDQAERFRMQATALGSYLLYGTARDFLAIDRGALGTDNRIAPAQRPSPAADFELRGGSDGFTLTAGDRSVALGGGGVLRAGSSSEAERFDFVAASGCPAYPEVELNTTGEPARTTPSYGEVFGTVDPHTHMMQYEAIGGRIWCGRPWHPYGAPHALVDCPDHEGSGSIVDQAVAGEGPHETQGWPTFRYWPNFNSRTHQQLYYKWLERSHKAGLRVFLNLFNEGQVLCDLYPYKRTPCNEMEGVRNQIRRIYELEDYIDAQEGGPGKGWFRIVTDPFEARKIINDGKLAVILGIETSKLFDCDIQNEVPACDRGQIDRGLAEVRRMGVRALFPIHKVDNALGGVEFDANEAGVLLNTFNFMETGRWWQIERCQGDEHDNEQLAPAGDVTLALKAVLAPGQVPVYPEKPHCNLKGLSELGDYLVRRMIATNMLIDPDHMSVRARNQTFDIAGAKGYSGLTSEHSRTTRQSYAKIFRLGGWANGISEDATEFLHEWREIRADRDSRFYFGYGYGSDTHGLHKQPAPRRTAAADPLKYPFKSLDGKVTLHRQKSGERVYDVNTDGVAHYGLFPDWIADMGKLAGPQFTNDMARGAESYLQVWERAYGIPGPRCRFARGAFKQRGLSWARIGFTPRRLLGRAGQPQRRKRTWTYCVRGKTGRRAKVAVVFTGKDKVGFVGSTGRGHEALHISRGSRSRRLRGARRVGRTLFVKRIGRRRAVYGVRRGRVRFAAVTTRSIAKSPRLLRRYVKLSGLR